MTRILIFVFHYSKVFFPEAFMLFQLSKLTQLNDKTKVQMHWTDCGHCWRWF